MLVCERCGNKEYRDPEKAGRRRSPYCSSCNAKPASTVLTAYGKCRPHKGQFDANDNPINEYGDLYRPGKRLCGYRDCIEKTHIEVERRKPGRKAKPKYDPSLPTADPYETIMAINEWQNWNRNA